MTAAGSLRYLKYFSYLPLCTAVLAITFDAGGFSAIGLGHFPLFGLSEHFLFAMEAIPYIIGFLFSYILGASLIIRFLPPQLRDSLYIFLLIAFIGSMASILAVSGHYKILVFLIGTIIALFGMQLVSHGRNDALLRIANLVLGLIVLSFVAGYETERKIFDQASDRYSVYLKDGTILRGELLKSGERGILFLTPVTKEIQFRRWDTIESIKRTTADLV